jgi:hypothetical protein
MSRLVLGLAGLVVAVGGLQWAVPRWTAQLLAQQLARVDGGAKPQIAIDAIPFWELAWGRFQDMYLRATDVQAGPVSLSEVQVNWENGQVNVRDLFHGRLAVQKSGQLAVRVAVSAHALDRVLQSAHTFMHPHVTIGRRTITIAGAVRVHKMTVPLVARGRLEISPNHQAVLFRPFEVDGLALPVVASVQLFSLQQLALPVALSIQRIRLAAPAMIVNAQTP